MWQRSRSQQLRVKSKKHKKFKRNSEGDKRCLKLKGTKFTLVDYTLSRHLPELPPPHMLLIRDFQPGIAG